eukprot:COSAG02_NODE_62624_length_265_cov_0.915663_1_plen_51_part_01
MEYEEAVMKRAMEAERQWCVSAASFQLHSSFPACRLCKMQPLSRDSTSLKF